jgi:flagellar secretion chaperone FliS
MKNRKTEGVMAWNSNPLQSYRETRVRTASQGRLVVMLYDEAIKQIDIACSYLDQSSKQLDLVHNAVVRAQEVVTELMVSLDFDHGGEIARNLFNLYIYFHNQLMEANVRKETKPLKEVRDFLATLRDAWVEIAKKFPGQNLGSSSGVNIAG